MTTMGSMEQTPPTDILASVSISVGAFERWRKIVEPAVQRTIRRNISVSEIPDERAETVSNGRLRVVVDNPRGGTPLAEMILGPEEWEWMS